MKDGSWQRWQVTDDAVMSSSCSPTRAPNIFVCHRGPSVTETIPEPRGSPNPLDGNLERDDMGGVLDYDMVGARQGKSSTHVPGRAIRAGQHFGGGRGGQASSLVDMAIVSKLQKSKVGLVLAIMSMAFLDGLKDWTQAYGAGIQWVGSETKRPDPCEPLLET